ncbi:hypothetical protein [Massilia aquatica]|uniref:Uncharacterized protein n=1 Tax=Massilia aquatica TaxID=2609000 RepID=A0ABX0M9H7_9BURK|nr:hypothetical protein [Massilia aquatica]NHZ41137.1 hypothetical protein [Massilia aquatica]
MTGIAVPEFLKKFKDEKRRGRVNRCLQSLQKRGNYSLILFEDFQESTTKLSLIKERLGNTVGENLTPRDLFETYAFSFISNAHAMIDSLGFAIFLIFEDLKFENEDKEIVELMEDRVTLNGTLADAISFTYPQHQEFADSLNLFLRDKGYQLLKKLSNLQKHIYLPIIHNHVTHLCIEISSSKNKQMDLNDFLKMIHNDTILKLFNLYRMLEQINLADKEEGEISGEIDLESSK